MRFRMGARPRISCENADQARSTFQKVRRPEVTNASGRNRGISGGSKVVRDATEKRVFFQDHSHSHPVRNSKSSRCTSALSHPQGQTFRAGCNWVDCDSPLLFAPSLDSPVRPACSLAASNRLWREDIKVVPCGAWGSVEEGTFVTL
jgi:hypothetical protein